jgi:hypothetical protein
LSEEVSSARAERSSGFVGVGLRERMRRYEVKSWRVEVREVRTSLCGEGGLAWSGVKREGVGNDRGREGRGGEERRLCAARDLRFSGERQGRGNCVEALRSFEGQMGSP